MNGDPHRQGALLEAGAPLARAKLAMILLHGRGSGARDMLALAERFALPDIAYFAPEAAGNSWWPKSFLAPLHANEPGISSGLKRIEGIAADLEERGFGAERIVVLGFSQGACLALEFAARSARVFRAVFGFSGGLIGTGDLDTPPQDALYGHSPKRFDYGNGMTGSTVFLGCHAQDPHIPLARVRESEAAFQGLQADVTLQVYPGAGHGIVAEEITFLRGTLNW